MSQRIDKNKSALSSDANTFFASRDLCQSLQPYLDVNSLLALNGTCKNTRRHFSEAFAASFLLDAAINGSLDEVRKRYQTLIDSNKITNPYQLFTFPTYGYEHHTGVKYNKISLVAFAAYTGDATDPEHRHAGTYLLNWLLSNIPDSHIPVVINQLNQALSEEGKILTSLSEMTEAFAELQTALGKNENPLNAFNTIHQATMKLPTFSLRLLCNKISWHNNTALADDSAPEAIPEVRSLSGKFIPVQKHKLKTSQIIYHGYQDAFSSYSESGAIKLDNRLAAHINLLRNFKLMRLQQIKQLVEHLELRLQPSRHPIHNKLM